MLPGPLPLQITNLSPIPNVVQRSPSSTHQSRLLLVSLLENFCQLYYTNPGHSQQLFFTICRALSAMNVIDEEWLDELRAVRVGYQRAFGEIVEKAMQVVEVGVFCKHLM